MSDVITIQSQVVHGHVGNSAAVYPMQAAGLEVTAVPTVLLSNHPHYPTMHGRVLDAELVASLLLGVEERGLVETVKVIVSGYLGSAANGLAVADFVRRAKVRNPGLVYVCDPVMGDEDLGLFVQEPLVALFRDVLVPLATYITPNPYEIRLLMGHRPRTENELREALASLCANGPRGAVATGCILDDTPADAIETVSWEREELRRNRAERLPIRPYGTGDLLTALVVTGLCSGRPLADAVARAAEQIAGFPFAAAST